MTNVYDEVRYPSVVHSGSHPARLSALACLYGRAAPPAWRCRVLEIGCGDGANLLSLAAAAPLSQFVGFDLAESAIAGGRAMAAAAGLGNLELSTMNILHVPDSLGEFDYVIAHGLYAWVPAAVREALMQLIGRTLKADGLAFLSYVTLPGCRLRQIMRDILQDSVRNLTVPAERLAAMYECMEFMGTAWSDTDPLQTAVRNEMKALLQRIPAAIFHDEMNEAYAPQLISDVVAHAERHGLRYLCDCRPPINVEAFFPSDERKQLRQRAAGDWVRLEQIQDFAFLTRYRELIFCRRAGIIDRRADWTRLESLHAQGQFIPGEPDDAEPNAFAFRVEGNARFTTTDARLADLLRRIGKANPGSIPLAGEIGGTAIGDAILQFYLMGWLSLQSEPFPFSLTPGERPVASPLARQQATQGETRLATLHHKMMEVAEPAGRHFITLLDGTRSRRELAIEMANFTGTPLETVVAMMNKSLSGLARAALLAG